MWKVQHVLGSSQQFCGEGANVLEIFFQISESIYFVGVNILRGKMLDIIGWLFEMWRSASWPLCKYSRSLKICFLIHSMFLYVNNDSQTSIFEDKWDIKSGKVVKKLFLKTAPILQKN